MKPFISSIRAVISSRVPDPSTNTVLLLSIVTVLQVPNHSAWNLSIFIPFEVLTTVAPVIHAMSSNFSALYLPKPGFLIAAQFSVPLALFTIKPANASPSISSAIINNGLF